MSTTPGGPTKVNEKALESIATGHYEKELSAPEAARTRAQTAYTIASATAAALVAAGALTDFGTYALVIQVLGALALTAWIAAAGLFMRVSRASSTLSDQASGAEGGSQTAELLTPMEFVGRALHKARASAAVVDRRLNDALRISWLALLLTGAVFIGTLIWPRQPEMVSASVVLSSEIRASLTRTCETSLNVLEGQVQERTLADGYVVIEAEAGSCREESVTILVPPKEIKAVVSDQEDIAGFPWED